MTPATFDSRALAVTAVLLLAVGAVAPAGVGAAGAADASSATTRTIERAQTLHLTPDAPGEIAVTVSYSLPSNVVELTTRLSEEATIASTDGFDRRDGSQFGWDERTENPTLTYRLEVNETREVTGPTAGSGEYTFVDAGDWALVRVPSSASSWSWTGGGTVNLSRTTETAGPGAVGDAIAFLGDHREVTRTAHGQRFRLVVPDRAELAESPGDVLDAMAAASDTLRVGDRDEAVFAVAAPTRSTQWGVRGLQTGDSDMWVRDVERLDTADDTWLHEYVHTRQDYAAAAEAKWFTEASATYYAALLSLEQGRIDFGAFRDRLAMGTRSPDASAVLADSSTWDVVAPYTKGALVAGELDRRTRAATNRTASLQDVLARLNEREGTVTGEAFREAVRQAGGDETAALVDRYVATDETPRMWGEVAHQRAFTDAVARIGYALGASGYRVDGPYRNGTLGSERPVRLATGETLAVAVNASNAGDAVGEYDVRLVANGRQLDRRTGRLAAGESRTLTFAHRFADPGEYALSVADRTVNVSVRRPATPTVAALNVSETDTRRDDSRGIAATATVRNDRPFPALANLTLYRDDEPVETRRVALEPGESRTIRYGETFVAAGSHTFRVGNRTAAVTVESRTGSVDGLGALATLVALAGALALAGRRRR